MQKPLFILYMDLGLGGIQRKIVDIVNYSMEDWTNLPIYIFLRRKAKIKLSSEIKNKNAKIIVYSDWRKFKIPFFFPIFIFYQVWKLKPQAILSFLNYVSLPSVWAKLLFFQKSFKVVLSEDYFTSGIISFDRLARLHHFLIKLFYPLADAIVVQTGAVKNDLIETYGVPKKKIKVIRNWTSFIKKKPIKRRKKFDLIYVGRLAKTKKLKFLLKAIVRLKKQKKDIKLGIVGEGEEKKNLMTFVKQKAIKENIEFLGAKTNIGELITKSRLLVFTSQFKAETQPLVILEAMAVGVPVLTRRFAGIEDTIEDGENGFIFASMEEFVEKTLWLLKNSSKRELIARRAKNYVKKYHSLENIRDYFKILSIKKNKKKIKIGLITSRGGHLFQLYNLKDWWGKYERFWITDRGEDSNYLLKKEKIYYGYFPESRNILNAIRNLFLGIKIIRKEKPDLLFSGGAGIAPPIFLAGKIMGCKLIFIEPYDFISYPSLSGRLSALVVDKLLVQQKIQRKFFKKAEYWGTTLWSF